MIVRTLACLLTLFTAISTFSQPYKNLVFEGGGIRGIAYVGAIEALEKEQVTAGIENVAGTSVGAITACLLSLGCTAGEMRDIMDDLRIQTFNDGRWFFFGGFARISNKFGWYRGDALEKWIDKHIKARTGSEGFTFRDLHKLKSKNAAFKDLYITATNLSRQQVTVFSWKNFPDMKISTAVRASMSVPLYFSAVFLDRAGNKITNNKKESDDCDVYIDGGVLANYPLTIFDSLYEKKYTIGCKLDRPEQITYRKSDPNGLAPYPIKNFKTYVSAFYNLMLEGMNSPTPDEATRTIYISTGNINPRVRKISRQQKQLLYDNGKNAATKFFRANTSH